jgi:hypothetical protein
LEVAINPAHWSSTVSSPRFAASPRHRQDLQVELVEAAGQDALQTLEELEQVRRLVAYGVALGRLGKDAVEFCRLMDTRPPLDKGKGIRGITPSFEWLAANRSTLRKQIKNIIPADL